MNTLILVVMVAVACAGCYTAGRLEGRRETERHIQKAMRVMLRRRS